MFRQRGRIEPLRCDVLIKVDEDLSTPNAENARALLRTLRGITLSIAVGAACGREIRLLHQRTELFDPETNELARTAND